MENLVINLYFKATLGIFKSGYRAEEFLDDHSHLLSGDVKTDEEAKHEIYDILQRKK